jgi:hypothetical protein
MSTRDLFQTEIKLEFVRRYCPPSKGWRVYVDIDPAEEGRGVKCEKPESQHRLEERKAAAKKVRESFGKMKVGCDGGRKRWCKQSGLPDVSDDRDILAFHPERKICWIAEVEGASSGQPEQKLYKAAGQLICAVGTRLPAGWSLVLVLAVNGEKLATHLKRMKALKRLGVAGVVINENGNDDWPFGRALK